MAAMAITVCPMVEYLKPRKETLMEWGFTDIAGRHHRVIGEMQNVDAFIQQTNAQAPATHGDVIKIIALLGEILAELRAARNP